MKIWHGEKKHDIDRILSFDGRSKKINWKPIKVKRMYKREFSNTPGFSPHIPVFDKAAVDILEDLVEDNAEILPLDCKEGTFFAINVTNIVDCINYGESEYKTFSNSNRIMRFIKYAFYKEKVEGHTIFKVKDWELKRPFVSDEFRKRVIDSNLIGFKFELAWDSEAE